MRIEDARKFVAVLMVSYPNYKPIDTELAAKTWEDVTEEYTYEQVNAALKIYMQSNTSGFAPVPGQIIENIHKMTDTQELNEMEAWSLVSKAIRNSGYNSVEEFAKLPPLVQKAVGLPDQLRTWALDENFSEDVVSSNFIKCYRAELGRHRELQKMPKNVRRIMESVSKDSPVSQIEQKRRSAIETATERKQGEIKALETKYEGSPPPMDKLEKFKKKMSD